VGLTFFDPGTLALVEFRPAAPPRVGLEAAGDAPRERAVHAALSSALVFLGWAPAVGAEVRVGGSVRGDAKAWLKVAALSGGEMIDPTALAARGYAPVDLHFFFLKTHYRKPLAFTWDALAAARAERSDLRAAAQGHAGVSLEPSARGQAGYLIRFRESLSKDLNFPDAVDCVWDALKPGALSPGSRAALLRETLPTLGIS
jgi:hypothetical protein